MKKQNCHEGLLENGTGFLDYDHPQHTAAAFESLKSSTKHPAHFMVVTWCRLGVEVLVGHTACEYFTHEVGSNLKKWRKFAKGSKPLSSLTQRLVLRSDLFIERSRLFIPNKEWDKPILNDQSTWVLNDWWLSRPMKTLEANAPPRPVTPASFNSPQASQNEPKFLRSLAADEQCTRFIKTTLVLSGN